MLEQPSSKQCNLFSEEGSFLPSSHKEDFMKYGKDEPFTDPVVRCDSCQKIILKKSLHELGMCSCGNRKVRALLSFTLWEYLKMRFWWRIDPEYLKIFGRSK